MIIKTSPLDFPTKKSKQLFLSHNQVLYYFVAVHMEEDQSTRDTGFMDRLYSLATVLYSNIGEKKHRDFTLFTYRILFIGF
jgi:hypothetical protein